MVNSPIVVPNQIGSISRSFNLGTDSHDIDDLYSPGKSLSDSVVLSLASPKYVPHKKYIFDKSKYGNHGTITGAVWKQLPSGLPYLDYIIDDRVSLGTDASLTPTGALTYICWVNPEFVNNNSQFSVMCAFDGGAYYARIGINSIGQVSSIIYKDQTTFSERYLSGMVASKWQFIGFRFTGSKHQLIRDDTLSTEWSWANALQDINPTTYLGLENVNIRYFTGGIALPRIFNVGVDSTYLLETYRRERHLFGV